MDDEPPDPDFIPCKRPNPTGLVVFVLGYDGIPKAMGDVVRVIQDALDDCDILRCTYSRNLVTFDDPNEIVGMLKAKVESRLSRRDYEKIVLIGYSTGALLTRKLYVCACGENRDAPFEPLLHESCATIAPWAGRVTRIVLLAGMNRGWAIDHHASIRRAVLWSVGTLIGYTIWAVRYPLSMVTAKISPRPPFIFTVRRGAAFITQLRLQWLSMRRNSQEKGVGNPATIQLLGTVDDLVAPEDSVDMVTGADFVYLEVPHSGHNDVLCMGDQPGGKDRAEALKLALKADLDDLRNIAVPLTDVAPPPADTEVKRVVFVIHGIRDPGFWTQRIAGRVKTRAKPSRVASITSSYGYFPMLSFLLPTRRRAKVRWLMDAYTEARARYPEAEFCYVGHSNGTYLLARALEDYPSARFDRVVFAGSVVRTRFDWARFMPPHPNPQVKSVLNFVATGDWVVAIFPKTIQTLRLQDLGSAGHDGFAALSAGPLVHEIKHVDGAHGAALAEKYWDSIADFINEGIVPRARDLPGYRPNRNRVVELLGRSALLVWGVIGLVVFGLGIWIYKGVQGEVPRTIVLLAYAWICLKILTRL